MKFKILSIVITAAILLGLASPALAFPPYPEDRPPTLPPPGEDGAPPPNGYDMAKQIDQPNPIDFARLEQRQRLLEAGKVAEANALATAGQDRVLVILVEYAGTDVFTWTNGVSDWDPYGIADTAQAVPSSAAPTVGDCSKIITQTITFTYTGPLHNQMPRPISEADRSGQSIWTPDFSPQWFYDFLFGNGVTFNYTRTDGSTVYANYTGKSVRNYYQEMSKGTYDMNGDVVGWVQLPHSTWWYGADKCPGARSVDTQTFPNDAAIPGAGTGRTLVQDTLDAVNALSNTGGLPGFSWKDYDLNGDGVIDRLWIVHAGYGEEDAPVLLNRTSYGESAVWSHSSSIPNYPVGEGISASPYIRMPENGGICVFAHEAGHNIGLADQYTYGFGNTSIGFWTLMSDSWTGYPIGFMPSALDAYSLNRLGWLDPKVVFDPNQVYEVTVGQASAFPGGTGVYRGVQIPLPAGQAPLPVQPWSGSYFWWGGGQNVGNASMTTKNPINLTGAATATLTFDLAYDVEQDWDFLWVQVSEDGVNWPVTQTLTNTHTSCVHDAGWIGGLYGFPENLCAAGIGGFSAAGHLTPATETFNLSRYVGKNIYLRWWYMTDWATLGAGPFVDNITVTKNGTTVVFSDNAESGDAKWNYVAPWERNNGSRAFAHSYYLQWRNLDMQTGGYDGLALGDSRWRYGPANTGLIVSYNNNFYNDNSIYNYLQDWPSFGPKGRHLAVDAQPEPYRDPNLVVGYPNAISNLASRGQMRDASFSRNDTVNFVYPSVVTPTQINAFAGRPAASKFDDALGYFPGLELARRGTLPCATFQVYDKMWDASVVLPATAFYTTKATGAAVTTATGIRMRGFISLASSCQAGWYGFWYVPYSNAAVGNTGNPGDENRNFGWRVQIMSQTAQTATLKIWNTRYYGALQPNVTVANLGDTVQYTYKLQGNLGSPFSASVCVPLDTSKVEYVAGSVTGGAVPLSEPCAVPMGQEATSAATVQSIGWTGYVDHNGSATFSFAVKIKAGFGLFDQDALVYRDGAYWATIPAEPVKVNPAAMLYLPIVLKQ